MTISKNMKAYELTLEELFPRKLTDTVCINIDNVREVWVATLMCAEYLDSFVDSIIVRDDDFKAIGIVGGFELLDHLRENPTHFTPQNAWEYFLALAGIIICFIVLFKEV
jgi:hypothetical protein